MKRILVLCLLYALGAGSVGAQIQSISFYSNYAVALGKRLAVTNATAVGGGVELRIGVLDNYSVSIVGGYDLFSLQQDSALAQWNWRFWTERYQGIVRDNLASDSSLSATLNRVQKMDLLPLLLTVNAEFTPSKDFTLRPFVGGGFLFYTRRMYLVEDWQKRFSAIGYTFEYSYRNFAQNKVGNPAVLIGGVTAGYQVNDFITLDVAARYLTVLPTTGKLGFDEFPFTSALDFKVGVSLLY